MSIRAAFVNSFANFVSGLGGSADHGGKSFFAADGGRTDDYLIEIYENSWMAAKGVNSLIEDALRGFREDVKIDEDLSTMAVIKEALVYQRVLGGGAVYMHVSGQVTAMETPLRDSDVVSKLIPLPPHKIKPDQNSVVDDLNSEWYGLPELFILGKMDNNSTDEVKIHISRLWIFADKTAFRTPTKFWSRGILSRVVEDIESGGASLQILEHLLHRMQVDTIKIPGLMAMCAESSEVDVLIKRFALDKELTSTYHTRILDADEDIATAQGNLTNVEPAVRLKVEMIAAGFNIPITKFLGSSPGGLNSTGQSDLDNYYAQVEDVVKDQIFPFLLFLDSHTGVDSSTWSFANPRPSNKKDEADADSKIVAAAKALSAATTPEIAARWVKDTTRVPFTLEEAEILTTTITLTDEELEEPTDEPIEENTDETLQE